VRIWKCYVYVGKHGQKGRIHNKFKGALKESCSCLWARWNHFQWWQGPQCYKGTNPKDWSVKDLISCMEDLHLGREDDIKIVQIEGAKCINTWWPTGAKGRPNRAEMGLGRSAQAGRPGPLRGSARPPFSCTRRSFNPKFMEAPPLAKQRAIRTERPSTS
jgi:hypothetical protein